MSKYNSKKTIVDGQTFDSRKEANRYQELLFLERVGAIKNLSRQVKFVLIPSQRDEATGKGMFIPCRFQIHGGRENHCGGRERIQDERIYHQAKIIALAVWNQNSGGVEV